MQYKKIMVFGRPGSGKSTFAYQLHSQTKIPLYHLDKYFFIANWAKRDYEEFMDIQNQMVTSESWIVDGNCTRSLETRYQHAELCVYFNFSKLLCLWRICKRIFHNRSHIDDRADGCGEVVRWDLIKYMWTFENRVAEQISQFTQKYPQVKFVEINNGKQLSEFLRVLLQLDKL